MSWGISDSELSSIIKFISKDENFVCGIVSPAGSGKSTKLVQKIYECNSKVFISEPTIPAAESLYRYMGMKLGSDKVGFAAEGNVKYSSTTPVVYCTTGHLRRKFLSYFENGKVKNGKIDFCDVLMLDEIHIGTMDYDVITELWNLAYQQGAEIPRLILASATMGRNTTIFDNLPVYEIKIKGFPVKEEYSTQNYDPNSRNILSDVASTVISKHNQIPVGETKSSKWLVFCPGTNEVDKVCQFLKTAELEKVEILPAYSTLQREQIDKIFDVPAIGTRTIIVATNIAEASITIDGLDGVFDTMLEKVQETAQSGGSRLVLQLISKSSADQRKGRTGRTNPGFCYRMITKESYDGLKEQREREIFRVPLTNIIIEMLDVGIDPINVFNGRVLEQKIRNTYKTLKDIGMIDKDKIVTDKGHFAPDFPLSVYNSALIWEWSQLTKPDGSKYPLFPAVVVASIIDCYGPSYFFYPKKEYYQSEIEYHKILEQHYSKYFQIFGGETDLEILLSMWNATCGNFQTLAPTKQDLSKWCSTHSLNNKKMTELFNVVRQSCFALLRNNYVVDIGMFSEKNVVNVLTPLLKRVYFKNVFVYQVKTKSYYNMDSKEYYKVNQRNMLNPNIQNFPKEIVGLSLAELPGKPGSPPIRLISFYQPV